MGNGNRRPTIDAVRKAEAPWSAPTSVGGPEGEVVL